MTYRKPGKQDAYETALCLATNLADIDLALAAGDSSVFDALCDSISQSHRGLLYKDLCQVCARALRVERGRRRRGAMGLYFPLPQSEVNALRARLNALAATFGYTAKRGRTTGQGNLSALLVAIDKGDVKLST